MNYRKLPLTQASMAEWPALLKEKGILLSHDQLNQAPGFHRAATIAHPHKGNAS